MRSRSIAVLLQLLALAGGALAQDTPPDAPAAPPREPRFTLSLGGGLGLGSLSYHSTGRFQDFAEQGRLETDYTSDSGGGVEAGLTMRLSRLLGVGAAFSALSRDTEADYQAELPHPLYLARNRQVEAAADGLAYDEQALHLDLVLHGSKGKLDLAAFAGPSWFKVESSLLGTPPRYTHSYPYDTASVTDVPRVTGDANAFGFNVGAGIDFRVTRRVAVGAQARFSRASVDLEQPEAEAVSLDAGGVQVTGGVRFLF